MKPSSTLPLLFLLAACGHNAPAAPSSLSATPLPGAIALAWPASAGAASYAVLRSTAPGGPHVFVFNVADSKVNDSTVVGGMTYSYVVRADNLYGESGDSPEATALVPPIAPEGLKASPGTSASTVALSWNAAPSATSYTVVRAPSTALATVTNPAYVDAAAPPGTKSTYLVTAINASGPGNPSSVQALTIPAAPQNPSASAAGSTSLQLTWTASTGADSYEASSSASSTGPFTVFAAPTDTSATLSGLASMTTRYFVVRALNATGKSDASAVVSATTN